MSGEYAVLWPPLSPGGPRLLTLKVLSRSALAFVREHWQRFDAAGMFVDTERDPPVRLGDALRFCVIGLGAKRMLAGRAVVGAIRRAAGGTPGIWLCIVELDDSESRTLYRALLEHRNHVEDVGAQSLPSIPPPLPHRRKPPQEGDLYVVRQRPVAPSSYKSEEFELIETSSAVIPLDDFN
ncbi:MAG: hypothetical protein KC503_26240 [Myxococcales bacterium]|nr:hypothetical protein [Myxococcales bacterium]